MPADAVQTANDRGPLAALAVADQGYYEADPLAACEQAGVATFVPGPGKTSVGARRGRSGLKPGAAPVV